MWKWTLNWSRLRDNLVIGSCPMTVRDIDIVCAETGGTALLSLQSDACRAHFGIDYAEMRAYAESRELAMVAAPMLDFDPPDQRRNLPRAVRSLRDLLDADHVVYLHCTAGLNRAPLTVLGYLPFVEMRSVDDAIALISTARPQASPSWEAYDGCRADLVEMLREYITVRAYYLSQEDPEAPSDSHWVRAEGDMIRASFYDGLPARWRLDPARA